MQVFVVVVAYRQRYTPHPHRMCLTTVSGKMCATTTVTQSPSMQGSCLRARSIHIPNRQRACPNALCQSSRGYRYASIQRRWRFEKLPLSIWICRQPPLVCIDAKYLAIPLCRTSRQSCPCEVGQSMMSSVAPHAVRPTMICSSTLRSCIVCVHPGRCPSGADSSMPI